MSNEAIAVPFHRCVSSHHHQDVELHSAGAHYRLRCCGPRVLGRHPFATVQHPDAVVETAVRDGVPLEMLRSRPFLHAVLKGTVRRHR